MSNYFNLHKSFLSSQTQAYELRRQTGSCVIFEQMSTGSLHLSVVASTATQPGLLTRTCCGTQAFRGESYVVPAAQPG